MACPLTSRQAESPCTMDQGMILLLLLRVPITALALAPTLLLFIPRARAKSQLKFWLTSTYRESFGTLVVCTSIFLMSPAGTLFFAAQSLASEMASAGFAG